MSGGSGLPSGAQMRAEVDAGLAAMQSVAQSAAEQMVRGLANGVSYIALEEWTMQARDPPWPSRGLRAAQGGAGDAVHTCGAGLAGCERPLKRRCRARRTPLRTRRHLLRAPAHPQQLPARCIAAFGATLR
jgi:hypothetical protein